MNSEIDIFRNCKLCGQDAAQPFYKLDETVIYRCRQCDFHFLNRLDHIPSAGDDAAQLTRNARDYLETRLDGSVQLHSARMKLVKKYTELSGVKALDIGAGLGEFQLLLADCGALTEGIEPSGLRRSYAREKFGTNLHRKLVDDPFWQSGYREHFDLVTLWDVIEHVDFPRQTLEHSVNLLKPGGLLCLDTPDRERLPYRFSERIYRLSGGRISLFLANYYSAARFGHKQIFTRHQLLELFADSGLDVLFAAGSYSSARQRDKRLVLVARKIAVPPQANN